MKKVILFLLILVATSLAQVRFLSYTGTTGTQVDTINFDFYVWEVFVINDSPDSLWFWTEPNASSNRKVLLLGGESINFRFQNSVNRVFLQASKANTKRRVIAKP